MKNSKAKQIDRYEVNDVDVDEVELDVDLDEAEEELEAEWVVMEQDSAETAELDDDADILKKKRKARPSMMASSIR